MLVLLPGMPSQPAFTSPVPFFRLQDLAQMLLSLRKAFADSSVPQVKSPATLFTALFGMLMNNCSCCHLLSAVFPSGLSAPEDLGCACLAYDHFIASWASRAWPIVRVHRMIC